MAAFRCSSRLTRRCRKKTKSATAEASTDAAIDEGAVTATTPATTTTTNASAVSESDDLALLRANQEAQRAAALQYNLTATRASFAVVWCAFFSRLTALSAASEALAFDRAAAESAAASATAAATMAVKDESGATAGCLRCGGGSRALPFSFSKKSYRYGTGRQGGGAQVDC